MSSERRARTIAVIVLVVSLVLSSTPISAADFSGRNAILGSLNATRPVQLRGIPVASGTLFPGDQISLDANSQADLVMTDGNKVQLFANTRSKVSRIDNTTQIIVTAGNIGFSASQKPLAVVVGAYEVLPQAGATGGVAFLGGDLVGIRIVRGSVWVRNVTTKARVQVTAGQVHLVNLKTQQAVSPVQLASMAPPSLPQTPRPGQTQPAGQTSQGINWALWGPIIGGIGAGAAIGIYEATKSNPSPSKP